MEALGTRVSRRCGGALLASFVVGALAAPATSSAAACPKLTGTFTGKSQEVTRFHSRAPEGEPLTGKVIKYPGSFYKTDAALQLRLNGNTWAIGAGAVFKLGCYAKSRSDRHPKPALNLLVGTVEVTTSARSPGGVLTEEGLFDPRQDPTMTYTVERTLTGKREPTLDGMLHWFANLGDQPTGTTAVASKTKAIIGVTPYVGSRPGSCRYVHAARLTTKGRYGKGEASYTP